MSHTALPPPSLSPNPRIFPRDAALWARRFPKAQGPPVKLKGARIRKSQKRKMEKMQSFFFCRRFPTKLFPELSSPTVMPPGMAQMDDDIEAAGEALASLARPGLGGGASPSPSPSSAASPAATPNGGNNGADADGKRSAKRQRVRSRRATRRHSPPRPTAHARRVWPNRPPPPPPTPHHGRCAPARPRPSRAHSYQLAPLSNVTKTVTIL